jgi:hypothetical protein
MVSVDLFEKPLMLLQNEARRRKWILFGWLGSWFLIMGMILSATYYMKIAQTEKFARLEEEHQTLKPKLAHYHEQYAEYLRQIRSQCTAMRINALFSSPIKGLYLSTLTVGEEITLNGRAEQPLVLDQYHEIILQNVDNLQWEESYQNGSLNFHVKGKLAC